MKYGDCTNSEPHPRHGDCSGLGKLWLQTQPTAQYHREDTDYHTCWCGKPWPCKFKDARPVPRPARAMGRMMGEIGRTTDMDGMEAGKLKSTVGRKSGWRVSGMVPRSYFRRKQRKLALWIRKHLTRTITRIEHGHGPGTLRVGDPITFGTEWTCGRCGGKVEW